MAKKQYRYTGDSKWMGLSGNALIALYNPLGSGKKLAVHSVEIYNKNTLGYQTGAADAFTPAPTRIRIAYVSAIAGGETLTPAKFNSTAAAWPSDVEVKTKSIYTPTYINWNGSVTYTDATVAVGDVTFTPGSAPGWIANEHRDAGRYFIGTSGNVDTYRIVANGTGDLTVEPPFTSASSTTGYVAEVQEVVHHGFMKTWTPATSSVNVSSRGYINQNNWAGTGRVFGTGLNTNQQPIFIRANERLAIFANNYLNASIPLFVEATLVVEGTPNQTYQLSFYTHSTSQNETLLSINNLTGSGEVVRLVGLSVTEVGALDTPYFQLVPFGALDPNSFTDTDKQLTAVPTNSADGALNTNHAKLFTNVPVIPSGVPISYIAEGAPAAATPRGFNYLNTKDFIGPAYMTYFPEAAAYKIPNTSFWTAGAPGTFGAHVSQEYSKIKGFGGAPIIVREGESIGLVSGAETATGTTSVGISGFGAYEFSLTFTVEDAVTPTVEFTGLKIGSEVRAYTGTDPLTATEIPGSGTESTVGTSHSFTHDVAGQNGYVVIFHTDYLPIKQDFTPYLAAVVSIPIQQTADRQYNNPT
jgi:hypothetical protein